MYTWWTCAPSTRSHMPRSVQNAHTDSGTRIHTRHKHYRLLRKNEFQDILCNTTRIDNDSWYKTKREKSVPSERNWRRHKNKLFTFGWVRHFIHTIFFSLSSSSLDQFSSLFLKRCIFVAQCGGGNGGDGAARSSCWPLWPHRTQDTRARYLHYNFSQRGEFFSIFPPLIFASVASVLVVAV